MVKKKFRREGKVFLIDLRSTWLECVVQQPSMKCLDLPFPEL